MVYEYKLGWDWERYVNVNMDASRGQKDVLHPLKQELQGVMSCPLWVLGTKLMSSGEASAPN